MITDVNFNENWVPNRLYCIFYSVKVKNISPKCIQKVNFPAFCLRSQNWPNFFVHKYPARTCTGISYIKVCTWIACLRHRSEKIFQLDSKITATTRPPAPKFMIRTVSELTQRQKLPCEGKYWGEITIIKANFLIADQLLGSSPGKIASRTEKSGAQHAHQHQNFWSKPAEQAYQRLKLVFDDKNGGLNLFANAEISDQWAFVCPQKGKK